MYSHNMYFGKVLLVIFTFVGWVTSSPNCAEVTHSDCGGDTSNLFGTLSTQTKEECEEICTDLKERCIFSLFDKDPFDKENCMLYEGTFKHFIQQCNELAGPRDLPDDCNLLNPPDNTCQVYRQGRCGFENVDETKSLNSWEDCHQSCLAIPQCQLWRFQKEAGKCLIMYSKETACKYEFSPQEPTYEECDSTGTTTTSPTTTSDSTCIVPNPQDHGDWFCLPSNDTATLTCHLECDPGYVSDSNTINICYHGEWTSSPLCVAAIALITGNYDENSGYIANTVELYDKDLHKKLPNLPDDRSAHSIDIVNSLVLLCGGGEGATTSCLSMTSTQQWNHHSNTLMKRAFHSSASLLGKLHLFGGAYFDSEKTTENLISPSDQWNRGWDLLERISSACATKIAPEMMLVSGGEYNPSSVLSYNVTSGVSTRLQDLTMGRNFHGCAYMKEPGTGVRQVFVVGGNRGNDNVALSSSEVYNMETGEWTTTGDLTTDRFTVKMVILGDNVLAMGGYSDVDGTTLSSVDRFNFTSKQWTATDSMLEKRWYHAVTAIPPNAAGLGQK